MFRADLHEGVEGAECDMQLQSLVEEAGNFTVLAPLGRLKHSWFALSMGLVFLQPV
jgi:hypothetical protein